MLTFGSFLLNTDRLVKHFPDLAVSATTPGEAKAHRPGSSGGPGGDGPTVMESTGGQLRRTREREAKVRAAGQDQVRRGGPGGKARGSSTLSARPGMGDNPRTTRPGAEGAHVASDRSQLSGLFGFFKHSSPMTRSVLRSSAECLQFPTPLQFLCLTCYQRVKPICPAH